MWGAVIKLRVPLLLLLLPNLASLNRPTADQCINTLLSLPRQHNPNFYAPHPLFAHNNKNNNNNRKILFSPFSFLSHALRIH